MIEAIPRDEEAQVGREARALVEQHGSNAVYIALDRLNTSIDRGDRRARDLGTGRSCHTRLPALGQIVLKGQASRPALLGSAKTPARGSARFST